MEDMVTERHREEGLMDTDEKTCRSCGSKGLKSVLDLGHTPLADALLTRDDLNSVEPVYPLEAAFCPACSLMQILETVPPDVLFCRDYPYYSSFSDALLKHSRENALALIESRGLGPESLVVEIASNDGYLLKNFVKNGVPCLGIDPAEGPARVAEDSGVPTLISFFTKELAEELRGLGRAADVVIANNVLAHVADTNGFLDGVRTLLKEDGVAVMEVPYVKDLIDNCEFDTIYHEHLCYFSLTSLNNLFRRHSLYINDVKRLGIHGGSLRIYAGRKDSANASVRGMLAEETDKGVDSFAYYDDFGLKVRNIKAGLRNMLTGLKESGKRIAAYGAAAKGSTLLNYIGLGRETIDFVADRNIHKQGRFMPGRRIPICGPERITELMPDYVLILAWNFAEEIIRQQDEYRRRGGRFILPLPVWKIE